ATSPVPSVEQSSTTSTREGGTVCSTRDATVSRSDSASLNAGTITVKSAAISWAHRAISIVSCVMCFLQAEAMEREGRETKTSRLPVRTVASCVDDEQIGLRHVTQPHGRQFKAPYLCSLTLNHSLTLIMPTPPNTPGHRTVAISAAASSTLRAIR